MTDHGSTRVIPPPLVYLVFFLAGLGLDYLWPLPLLPRAVQYALGFTILALGFLLFGLALREFVRHGTSVDPRKATTAVISSGPFRHTRNPIYVAMNLLMVGLAVAIDSPWILLMLIPADLFIHRFVVLREEAAMERQFGDAYRRYKAGVRRWL